MNDIVIRPVATVEEREACVALQELTWGEGFADRVPASILMVAQEMGGVVSGAFQGERLVGFVFGITGFRGGRRAHWSDMLAVLPGYRGRGLGYRLKLHQRDLLLALGVETVFWTFDPLVSRNAHLNLRRLGAITRTYERDLYGRSNSPLHQGIGTDRLMAEWWISVGRVGRRLAGAAPEADRLTDRALVNPPAAGGRHPRPGADIVLPETDAVEIAVPSDIHGLRSSDPGLALDWRINVRAAFESAFGAGYTAVDLIRDDGLSRYVLTRTLTR